MPLQVVAKGTVWAEGPSHRKFRRGKVAAWGALVAKTKETHSAAAKRTVWAEGRKLRREKVAAWGQDKGYPFRLLRRGRSGPKGPLIENTGGNRLQVVGHLRP